MKFLFALLASTAAVTITDLEIETPVEHQLTQEEEEPAWCAFQGCDNDEDLELGRKRKTTLLRRSRNAARRSEQINYLKK